MSEPTNSTGSLESNVANLPNKDVELPQERQVRPNFATQSIKFLDIMPRQKLIQVICVTVKVVEKTTSSRLSKL